MTKALLPKIIVGKHRKKPAFQWRENGKPRYRVIERPDNPKDVEEELQALFASMLAGGNRRVKLLQQPLVDADYAATEGTHLFDFMAEVPGKSAVHKINLLQRNVRFLQKAGCRSISHAAGLTEAKANAVINSLRHTPRKPKGKEDDYPLLSERSRHHYRRAIKQFFKWLARNGFIKVNPLADLKCPRVRKQTNPRDQLQPVELQTLFAAIEVSPNFRLYSSEDRVWLYRVAAFTGYRKSELATLRPESFRWKEHVAVVHDTKNDEPARQPLPPDLLPLLRVWVESKPKGQPLWPGLADKNAAKLLQRDMREAGLPILTPDGKRAFHSLRNSYICSLLRVSGNNIKLVQKLARHRDVETTLSYARFTTNDERQAVAALPGLLAGPAVVQGVVQEGV